LLDIILPHFALLTKYYTQVNPQIIRALERSQHMWSIINIAVLWRSELCYHL